ncbi:hypothetical protein [Paraburkholderia humisilvae]|uniref:Uncharacterized protein n=1 Tax=Paraburkholderia humisilvae TaxID=627669 RepID=A0A6J5DPD2_9BURK|nr:hypothetical protein [Paraburkholderia humisilvae]CAB3754845.1 hypothetical protein LMG29542_02468 [Paraburkholderia humisilvae]
MASYSLPIDECLQVLARVDAGSIQPERLHLSGGTGIIVRFSGAQMEALIIAGKRPGVALDVKAGRVLVRRKHAVSERFAVGAGEYLIYYWITDAGRQAASK